MIGRAELTKRLAQGGMDFTSAIAEQALMNDALRAIVMPELEKLLLSQVEKISGPTRPKRIVEDKKAMARGLVRAADRALARGQISPNVLRKLLKSLLGNTALVQQDNARAARERFVEMHGAQPPSTILISPTKTCNLKCVGCYASCEPGEKAPTMEWEVLDRIVTEAKELWGLRFISISGGEPFTYRSNGKTLMDLMEKHNDCFFQAYTNGTLFTKRVAARLAEVGNFSANISVEGFEEKTDGRRGKGVYKRILDGMANLREAGVPFGISLTATKYNTEEILSDEFMDFFFDEQWALYGWMFQYMPIGRSYTLDLLPTPEQRAWMWKRSWEIVERKEIMLADFWNFGTVSDGCIAAAREAGYMYIDWNGKVTPCVFMPYAATNIYDVYKNGGTLDTVYDTPFFKAIRGWQYDYAYGKDDPMDHKSWVMPCPIRDHHAEWRKIMDEYQAEPEDEMAAQAILDGQYFEGMLVYDEELHKVMDPIWEQHYLNGSRPRAD
jgi:MoaA/NifB/PqqE/SkfB family radical SAM enzyme